MNKFLHLFVGQLSSCEDIREASVDSLPSSGTYHLLNIHGPLPLEVYCEFHHDHGYMFLSKENWGRRKLFNIDEALDPVDTSQTIIR